MFIYPVQIFASLILLFISLPVVASESVAGNSVDSGQQLFEANCMACHQAGEHGAAGMAPVLTNADFLAIASDTFLYNTIHDGRMAAGMPPASWLGEQKIRAIISYLRSQSTLPDRSASVNKQPAATGSAAHGAELFQSICSTCHGIRGQGYEDGNTGTHIGNPAFLRVASDGFLRDVIKHGRRGTAMHPFSGSAAIAALSDQEIDDIIVFLRSLSMPNQGDS